MTIEEARKVASVCQEADSGCPNCVQSLVDLLIVEFPEFTWSMDDTNDTILVEDKK